MNSVSVVSLRDDRRRPLLPKTRCDNVAVCALPTDEKVTCASETRTFYRLGNVPVRFMRLGMDSRRLVLSLYNAIVERFFVMKSSGMCTCRPLFGRNLNGIGGFSEIICADCNCETRYCLCGAITGMRRAFGTFFRDVVKNVVQTLRCDVYDAFGTNPKFYPPTPFGGLAGRLFCQPDGGCDWHALMGSWLGDMSMWRSAPGICLTNHARCDTSLLRPLLWDVVQAYSSAASCGLLGDARGLCNWARQHLDDFLPCQDDPLGNFGGSGNDWANAIFGKSLGRCECETMTQKFYLPALALALRILSVWNVQTVRRCGVLFCTAIPHVRIRAKKTFPFGSDFCGPETVCFAKTCELHSRVIFCAKARFSGGSMPTVPGVDVYMDIDFSDETNPNHIIQLRPGTSPSSYPIDPNYTPDPSITAYAEAEICAVWPCFSRQTFDHFASSQAGDFPAKWAWNECDVEESYVTGFLKASGTPRVPANLKGVFRYHSREPGFGTGFVTAIDGAVKCIARMAGEELCRCSNSGLTAFPLSRGDAMDYLGQAKVVCSYTGNPTFNYIGFRYCYITCGENQYLYAILRGGEPRLLCYDVDRQGYHVAQYPSGAHRSGAYCGGDSFSMGPISAQFGGTFFETYKFNNRFVRQTQ